MVDLAVKARQHAQVAVPGHGNGGRSAPSCSFEQLLQGSLGSRHLVSFFPEKTGADERTADRATRPDASSSEESRARPKRRMRAEVASNIGHGSDDGAAPTAWREPDHCGSGAARTDRGRRADAADARADRDRSRSDADPPAENVDPPASGSEAVLADTATTTFAPSTRPSGPGVNGAASAAPATGWAALMNPADSPPPQAATTPVPGQTAASVINDADILFSQPGSALAPAAVIAAEGLQGHPQRLRPTGSGIAAGTATDAATLPLGADDSQSHLGAQNSSIPGAAGRFAGGAPATSAANAAGAAETATPGGGASFQAALGQNTADGQTAAMLSGTTGLAASPPTDKPAIASSAATSSEGLAAPGIGTEGATSASVRTVQPPVRLAGAEAAAQSGALQQRVVGDQVSVHIRKAVQEGMDRIEVRLKPEALGRVDVRLELGPDNRVVATVTAEQRHTLELLRADARSLERALQEAGLQTDGGSLNFNLRGGEDGKQGHDAGHAIRASLHEANADDGDHAEDVPARTHAPGAGRPDGVDIHA